MGRAPVTGNGEAFPGASSVARRLRRPMRRPAGQHLDPLYERRLPRPAAFRTHEFLQIRIGHLDPLPWQRRIQRLGPLEDPARLCLARSVHSRWPGQAVELTQLLVFLLKKPNLLGGCCGSDHPADRAVDQSAGKIVVMYPYG